MPSEQIDIAWEQAKKLAYVTLVKLLLESLAAACLQAQAFLLAAVLNPEGVYDLLAAGPDNPSPEDIISNLGTEKDSSMAQALNEVGIFSTAHLDMPESIQHAKNLFSDVAGLVLKRTNLGSIILYFSEIVNF